MTLPALRHAAAPLVLTATLIGTVTACSGSSGGGAPASGSAAAAQSAHVANVTITSAKGCELDHTQFAAGGITFNVTNKDATAVSEIELLEGERILGEKENIPPGLGGQFAVKVDAGTYTVYCPGAPVEKSTIKVTGRAAPVSNNLAALSSRAPTTTRSMSTTRPHTSSSSRPS